MSDMSYAEINFSDPQSQDIFKKNKLSQCKYWNDSNKELNSMSLHIMKKNDANFFINGRLKNIINRPNLYVRFWASSPPTYNCSFSGSGVPYPSREIAFQDSKNIGKVPVQNNQFSFYIQYPNSYYDNLGTVYVPPTVIVQVFENDKEIGPKENIILGEGIPYRSLTFNKKRNLNDGPMFYNNQHLKIRSQYQILLDSSYPDTNKEESNFWGSKPAR